MAKLIKTENLDGSDAGGSSGNANRTLTLSNTGLTETNGFNVSVAGLDLKLADEYTVVHNASSSVITFLNQLWDDQTIIVQYTIPDSGSGVTPPGVSDFEKGPLTDHGVTVSRTPITETNDNITGDRLRASGTPVNIQMVFMNIGKIYSLDKSGEQENADINAYIAGDVTVNKEDELTWNSYVFRVESVSPRYFDGTIVFQKIILRLITPA